MESKVQFDDTVKPIYTVKPLSRGRSGSVVQIDRSASNAALLKVASKKIARDQEVHFVGTEASERLWTRADKLNKILREFNNLEIQGKEYAEICHQVQAIASAEEDEAAMLDNIIDGMRSKESPEAKELIAAKDVLMGRSGFTFRALRRVYEGRRGTAGKLLAEVVEDMRNEAIFLGAMTSEAEPGKTPKGKERSAFCTSEQGYYISVFAGRSPGDGVVDMLLMPVNPVLVPVGFVY